jgi:hypothetical protein
METRIMAIIEADLKAQENLKQAEMKINEAIANIVKEKALVQNEVWDKAKRFVEDEKVKLNQQLIKTQSESLSKYAEALEILETQFNQQKDSWRKTLLERCIQHGE